MTAVAILYSWLSVLIIFVLVICFSVLKDMWDERDGFGLMCISFCTVSSLALLGMFIIVVLQELKLL